MPKESEKKEQVEESGTAIVLTSREHRCTLISTSAFASSMGIGFGNHLEGADTRISQTALPFRDLLHSGNYSFSLDYGEVPHL